MARFYTNQLPTLCSALGTVLAIPYLASRGSLIRTSQFRQTNTHRACVGAYYQTKVAGQMKPVCGHPVDINTKTEPYGSVLLV